MSNMGSGSETLCPFCKGRRLLGGCDACSDTGDYEVAKLMRAARLGEAAGYAMALHRLEGGDPYEVPRLTWKTVRSAVVDDLRRQRHEEMLMPESREMQKARAEVDRLLREREPLLTALGDLAAELREQLSLEVPA